jgi:murein DD-endopeptidase MepM/ murein hydrolase activator NlpD
VRHIALLFDIGVVESSVSRVTAGSRFGKTARSSGARKRNLFLFGGFASLLATNVFTGVAFLMSGDISRVMSGENQRVLSAYEDRIVVLRMEVDRLHSRQYAQAGSLNLQMQDLILQQEMLAEQHEYVRALADKAGELGIETASLLPSVADAELAAYSVVHGSDIDTLRRNLDGMLDDSRVALNVLSDAATESTNTIVSELRRIGIAAVLPPDNFLATGGPYEPAQPEAGIGLIDEANAVASALDRFGNAKSMLDEAPIQPPLGISARISSPFGNRPDPFVGSSAFHAGMDFAASAGTDVFSAGAGKVVYAARNGGYGNMIEIEHEDGLNSRYGHLSAILVRDGQRVEAGDLIGRVGSTGRSTGPHLHFEVRRADSPIDPSGFLAAGRRLAAFL